MIPPNRWSGALTGLLYAAAGILLMCLSSCSDELSDDSDAPDADVGTDGIDEGLDWNLDTGDPDTHLGDPGEEEPLVAAVLHPRFEPDGEGFFRMPWPSDYRRDEQGHLELGDFPRATDFMVETYVQVAEDNLTAFGTMPVVYIGFDHDPTPASLPQPRTTLEEDSPVQLVDISEGGCGDRIPIEVHFEVEGDSFLDANTLEVAPVPGFVLAPATPYALVVLRTFGSPAGSQTEPPETFAEILEGTSDLSDLAAIYDPLLDCADSAGISLNEVAVATVFTTQDPTAELRLMRDQVVDPVRTAAPTVTGWSYSESGSRQDHFDTYTGTYQTPIFQVGQTPYSTSGGGLAFDEYGDPIVQRWETVPFAMSFPLQGTAPFPVLIWEPGTGADLLDYTGSSVLREALAAGFAVASFQPQFHGSRSGAAANPELHSFNYVNPESGRTVFRQQVVDTAYFVRVVRQAVGGLEGVPALDTSNLVYGGHSQGAIVGGLVAGVETEFVAYVLNGIGAYLSITIIERQDPQDINLALQGLLGLSEPLDQFHPVVALAQLAGEVVDPINYAPYWRGRTGFPNGSSLFLTNGAQDHTTPLRALNAVTIAGRVQPIEEPGWNVDPFDVWEMAPAPLPIQGNAESVGGTRLTIATELVETTGHYTIYDRGEVRARAIRFWVSALDGIPVLTAQ